MCVFQAGSLPSKGLAAWTPRIHAPQGIDEANDEIPAA
jgi:hypothetical protein